MKAEKLGDRVQYIRAARCRCMMLDSSLRQLILLQLDCMIALYIFTRTDRKPMKMMLTPIIAIPRATRGYPTSACVRLTCLYDSVSITRYDWSALVMCLMLLQVFSFIRGST